jgi:hypothetical protein
VGFGEIGGHPRKGPKSVRLAYALAYDRPDIRFVCFTRLRERPWHGKRHELAELTQGPRRTVVNLFAWSDQIENGADVNGESSTTTRRRDLGQTARRKRRSAPIPGGYAFKTLGKAETVAPWRVASSAGVPPARRFPPSAPPCRQQVLVTGAISRRRRGRLSTLRGPSWMANAIV